MMGPDCETILSGINEVERILIRSISSLAASMGRISVNDGLSEIESPTQSPADALSNAMSKVKSHGEKAKTLGDQLFTSVDSFNNSAGSPWTEINNLLEGIDKILLFAKSHSSLRFIGEKSAMMALMNMGLSLSVDAKYALLLYHDYLQRGFDYEYNGKIQQVVHKSQDGTYTTGNINQDYSENVNTPRESLDPF